MGALQRFQLRQALWRLDRQRGFTLIEVLVGFVLATILMIGLNGLWSASAEHMTRLGWRQLAVMALSSELARLSQLHAYGSVQTVGVVIEGEPRTTYAPIPVDGLPLDADASLDFDEVRIDAATGAAFIALDPEQRLAGRFSWTADDALEGVEVCAPGGVAGVTGCALVEARLDYPFRVDDAGAPVAVPPLEQVTLSTVFGGRNAP